MIPRESCTSTGVHTLPDPSIHTLIRLACPLAGPPLSRPGRQGARVLRSPSPPARPDPSRRAGDCAPGARRRRRRDVRLRRRGRGCVRYGRAGPCSPSRRGDRRPPGSGPPGASEGSVAGWGAEATNGPPRLGDSAPGSRGRWWPDPPWPPRPPGEGG